MKKLLASAAVALAVAAAPAHAFWGSGNSGSATDTDTAEQLEKMLAEASRQVGLPNIVNFFEARMVKMLYELRDNPEYRTWTYIMAMDGTFIKICDSVGFGINASIQMANPEKVRVNTGGNGGRYGTLPQAEPNGLFMPEGLAATYALCTSPGAQSVDVVYLEPDAIVSPFPFYARDARTGEMTNE